jgi:hypothetical protein
VPSLKQVQENLDAELKSLRDTLGLKENENLNEKQAKLVAQFHKKSGFSQFWLSYWNKNTLAPALAFEALRQWKEFSEAFMAEVKPAQATPEEQAFLALFPQNQNEPLKSIEELLISATQSGYLGSRATLRAALAAHREDAEKNKAVIKFLSELRNNLFDYSNNQKSKDPTLAHKARIIADYMNASLDDLLIPEWKLPTHPNFPKQGPNAAANEPSKGLPPIDLPKTSYSFDYSLFFGLYQFELKPANHQTLSSLEKNLSSILTEERNNQEAQQHLQRQVAAAKKDAPGKLSFYFGELIRSFHHALAISGKSKAAPVPATAATSASPVLTSSSTPASPTQKPTHWWSTMREKTPNPFKKKTKPVDETVFTLPENRTEMRRI